MMTLLFNALSTVKDSMNIPTSFLVQSLLSYKTDETCVNELFLKTVVDRSIRRNGSILFSGASPLWPGRTSQTLPVPFVSAEYQCWKS